MRCTWRGIAQWLAVCGLLAPVALRADDICFRGDSRSAVSTAVAQESGMRMLTVPTEPATYETSDPTDVLERTEVNDSDIQLTANQDAAPAPGLPDFPEPTQTAAVVTDEPMVESFVVSDPCVACSCRRGWRPFAGAAATFLAPSHNTGGGSAILNGNYATGGTTLDRSATDREMNIAPRLWLGVQGEQWGAVVRYWNWSSQVGGLSAVPAVLPVAGSAGSFTQNYLHLQTLDAEVTRYLNTDRGEMWLSFGFRYAAFQRGSSLMTTDRVGAVPTLITSSAMESTNFYGGGLTGGVFGKRPISGTHLSWIYSGRLSVIWDPSSKSLAMTDVIYGGPGGFNNFNGGLTAARSTLFMSEIQLGMQYDRALKCVPASAFFRTAFEWQYWNLNHGNSAVSASSGGVTPGAVPSGGFATAISRASGTTLDMLGFNIATGFNW